MLEEGIINGLTPVQRTVLKFKLSVATVAHVALLMCLPVYGALGYLVGGFEASKKQEFLSTTLIVVLAVVSVITVSVGFALYGWLADPRKMAQSRNLDDMVRKWVTAVIVRDALLECAAIFGLLIVFYGGNPIIYAAFGGPVFLLFIITWPTFSSFEERLAQGRDLLRQES